MAPSRCLHISGDECGSTRNALKVWSLEHVIPWCGLESKGVVVIVGEESFNARVEMVTDVSERPARVGYPQAYHR